MKDHVTEDKEDPTAICYSSFPTWGHLTKAE
jgi:hypothetical protein